MKKRIAINTHLFLAVILFFVFVSMTVSCALSGESGWAIGFAVVALFPLFVFFISPLYFVFSDDEVKIVYHFGQKEVIQWNAVKKISLVGSWIGGGGMPHYIFSYPTKENPLFFVRGEIPQTRKTKKLIRVYYKSDVS